MLSFFVTTFRLFTAFRNGLRDSEFRGLLYFVVILLIAGTIFYTTVEGWRWLDSLYFSVVTLTTIGYGDFTPKTDVGKLFTISYVFVGLGTILAFVNLIAHHASDHAFMIAFVKRKDHDKDPLESFDR